MVPLSGRRTTWDKADYSFDLSRDVVDKEKESSQLRVQVPKPPFPYRTKIVQFKNGTLNLSGGLTIPNSAGTHPCVVLLPGSKPGAWKPEVPGKPGADIWMWVLADQLTRAGVATLRMDPRGTGGTGGDYEQSTISELAEDALAAVHYLQTRSDIDAKSVGILGHSEGGILAPLAASSSKDIAFLILLSAPTLPLDQSFSQQPRRMDSLLDIKRGGGFERFLRANDELLRLVKSGISADSVVAEMIHQFADPHDQRGPNSALAITLWAWSTCSRRMRSEIAYDPAISLCSLKIPILALYGDKDVFLYPAENRSAFLTLCNTAKNRRASCFVFPELSHWFHRTTNGIERTTAFSIEPAVLEHVTKWLAVYASAGTH